MQTFLPYPDFARSAQVLDNKRLGKQRVECLQILKTLAKEQLFCYFCKLPRSKCIGTECNVAFHKLHKFATTPWYNHPAVKMWRGYEYSLRAYALIVCTEWMNRGFNDSCYGKIFHCFDLADYVMPPWLGNEQFHASHRSNLLRKDLVWYSKFGWTEPLTLEYVWPVK